MSIGDFRQMYLYYKMHPKTGDIFVCKSRGDVTPTKVPNADEVRIRSTKQMQLSELRTEYGRQSFSSP